VLYGHPGLGFIEDNTLRVAICVAIVIAQHMCELDPVATLADGPFPAVNYFIGFESLELRVVGLAHRAHAYAHEVLSWLGLVITHCRFVIHELFDRTHDGVVQLRVILRKPLAKIFVVFGFETLNHTRPVEPRAAIVAAFRIRKQKLCSDRVCGDLGAWEFLVRCEAGKR
jgi:hypothetical protein